MDAGPCAVARLGFQQGGQPSAAFGPRSTVPVSTTPSSPTRWNAWTSRAGIMRCKTYGTRLLTLEHIWHASHSDIITGWNRLLSRFQPFAHAATVAINGGDWLAETRTNLPFQATSELISIVDVSGRVEIRHVAAITRNSFLLIVRVCDPAGALFSESHPSKETWRFRRLRSPTCRCSASFVETGGEGHNRNIEQDRCENLPASGPWRLARRDPMQSMQIGAQRKAEGKGVRKIGGGGAAHATSGSARQRTWQARSP